VRNKHTFALLKTDRGVKIDRIVNNSRVWLSYLPNPNPNPNPYLGQIWCSSATHLRETLPRGVS